MSKTFKAKFASTYALNLFYESLPTTLFKITKDEDTCSIEIASKNIGFPKITDTDATRFTQLANMCGDLIRVNF